ncbi:MAG: hypothetical protein GW748_07215 [Alphaproteobacteria bacterium]|nr:hypothetical protein [Candidatus Parcubacteria bacterium]NCQ67519.1 hypothetical protein [Alphaproteobacteria bacterium]
MKNLIFVSKATGLECLKFHLKHFQEDENFIVVSNPDKKIIINYLKRNKVDCCELDDFSYDILKGKHFDWLLNLWGGYIFKKDILSIVKNSLNIHPSYLPYGRGRDPVVWAIRDSSPAGVTLHEINEEIDAGSIWHQEKISYQFPIKGEALYQNVINACIQTFKEQWPNIRELKYNKKPQKPLKSQIRKRKDLLEDQIIKYELLTENQRELLVRIIAHDFGEAYSSILEINGNQYQINLNCKKITGK